MREIKFRAWDGNKVVDFGDLMCKQGHFNAFINTLAERTAANKPNNPKYKLMQYTGLKDKNGVEIYEGDILERPTYLQNSVDTEIGPVYYTNRGTWDWYSYLLGDKNERATVIGNIYENPELLEANQ